MGSIWTVTPEVVRVELAFCDHDFWIELKKRLNTGETKRLETSALKSYSRRAPAAKDESQEATMELNVDFEAAVFEKVRIWLADWSLTDDKGDKLKRDIDTFRALDPDLYAIIEQAVDRHAAQAAAASKKASTPEVETSIMSPLRKISSS